LAVASIPRSFVVVVLILVAGLLVVPSLAVGAVTVTAAPIVKELSASDATAKVKVENTGETSLRRLTFSVKSKAGVRIQVTGGRPGSLSQPLKTLPPGQSTTVTMKLRRVGDGPKAGTLHLRVTRRGKTLGQGTLKFGAGGSTPPPGSPVSVVGKVFRLPYESCEALGSCYTYLDVLYFPNDRFLWRGTPIEEAKPTCSAITVTADSYKGCMGYTIDAETGAITIQGDPHGDRSGVVKDQQVTLAPGWGSTTEWVYTEGGWPGAS
jgi:hypothetical protein